MRSVMICLTVIVLVGALAACGKRGVLRLPNTNFDTNFSQVSP